MKLQKQGRDPRRRGWAMVFAVSAAVLAATMASLMFLNAMTSARITKVNQHRIQAEYLAEGAVEAARKEVLEAIANWSAIPSDGNIVIDGVNVPFTILATGFAQTVTDPSGIQSTVTGYHITATATAQGSQATAHRIINSIATPIFQFAVFYTNDLEIFPGPDMELYGRVHTNGDMYLGSGSTLTVNTNYCRSVGGIYRSRKDDPSKSTGTVNVRKWVGDPYDASEPEEYFSLNSIGQMLALGVATKTGYDANFSSGYDAEGDGDYYGGDDWLPWGLGALEYWSEPDLYAGGSGNTVLTSEHGMTESVSPSIGSISMFEELPGGTGGDFVWQAGLQEYVPSAPGAGTHEKGFFHGMSGLTILSKPDGTWTALDEDGFDVTTNLVGGAVQLTTMYDARQGGDIQVIEVDVALLNSSGQYPANGLLYASGYGNGTGTDLKGVKLVNGWELKGPLTVVSEGAVYVQGDFNTVNKVGAAVIGDAVNLLSNAWDDSKSGSSLPSASNTTYNMAIITGNQATKVGGYNGGLENLPRFHESWSGKSCNISGSFVNTWESNFASGGWKYGGDRYKAPGRNWRYDPFFNTVGNLPPFTPMAVSAEDVVAW